MHVRRRILKVSNSQNIKYSSKMLAIQGWSTNIIIAAMGTTIILMLLFLCLKSSQTHKKHNELAECQGSSDICERMSRIWPWAPQPPSPEQSIIGTSCSEGMLEEVIEKGKVTSVSVQIPTIYKEEQEAEQYLNQYNYDHKQDISVRKSDSQSIENMMSSEYFIYPSVIQNQFPENSKLYLNPNSHENLMEYSSKTPRNVNYPQRNVPSNTLSYSGNRMYNTIQSANAQKECDEIMKSNAQHQNIYGNNPNMASTSGRYSHKENTFIEQEKSPKQSYQNKPLSTQIKYPNNNIYSPINNSHSIGQSGIKSIPQNTFSINKNFGYIPIKKIEPIKITVTGQNVPGHNSQVRYEPIINKGAPVMHNPAQKEPSNKLIIMRQKLPYNNSPARYDSINKIDVPVNPKIIFQKLANTNKYNNLLRVPPIKITQNNDTPPMLPQFKVTNTTGRYAPRQSQIMPHPVKPEYTNKGSEHDVRKHYTSSSQSVLRDVKYTTGDQKPYRSSSDDQFPKTQKKLKDAYEDPIKFVQRSSSDEIPLKLSLSKRVSFKGRENLTGSDILDISTSKHKSDSILSDEIAYTPIDSLTSNEDSKHKIVRQLSQFSSLFPEDPKNPIPKDPLTLPPDKNFEMMRMSTMQLSEKISEIGSRCVTESDKFKMKNKSSNINDVNKKFSLFKFRNPNCFQTYDHKSNENIMLNSDSVTKNSTKSCENIEMKLHHTELDNSPQPMLRDVKYATVDQFPETQKNLKDDYQEPMKFVQRSSCDEVPVKTYLTERVSIQSRESLTAPDILDISTSKHKSDSNLSGESAYVSIGSLYSSEDSKQRIVRRLSEFSSLFPDDPMNRIPKDPSTLPFSNYFEKRNMSSTQLSEKNSDFGSRYETGTGNFKTGNKNINYNDRDSVPKDISKQCENIEISIHHTESDNGFEDTSENKSVSIEIYHITFSSSAESLNHNQRDNEVDEVNKGKKCNSLEILCGNSHLDDNFTNKSFKYVDYFNQTTLDKEQINMHQSGIFSNKISNCPTNIDSRLERNFKVQVVPPTDSEELCCLHLSSTSNQLLKSVVGNNQEKQSVVTNNTFQCRENLKCHSTVGTPESEQLKDSMVFNIPETVNHELTLPNISTPEMTSKIKCDLNSKRNMCNSHIKNKVTVSKTNLQNGETSNLPKTATVLKWRVVMEKSKLTK